MPKAIPPKPTPAELSILQVLWANGPSTVREVHEALKSEQTTGYTTVLKLMQIMAQKGLVSRDETQKTHVYSPCVRQDKTQRQLVKDLMERAFSGSAERLVLSALEGKKVSADELNRIRQLLDEIEGDQQ